MVEKILFEKVSYEKKSIVLIFLPFLPSAKQHTEEGKIPQYSRKKIREILREKSLN